MRFGVHSLVFSDRWDGATAPAICRAAAEAGFDHVEVLLFDPAAHDIGVTRRALAGTGLGLRLGMALPPAADLSSPDLQTARRGEAMVAQALRLAADLGAPAVSGITYAAFAAYTAPPTAAQAAQVAAALGRLDALAGSLGLRLGIEPVNRYESYLVNTLDEAAALIAAAGGQHLFVHLDTFHMHIEERDIAAAIARNAALLGYAHVAESHRGLLGTGSLDLHGLLRALAAADYRGELTFEAFSARLLGPALVGGVRLWRDGFADPAAAAAAALALLRAGWTAAAAAAGRPD